LGEEIKEVVVVEKVLRSLSSMFESKVSAIEEKQKTLPCHNCIEF